MSVLPALLSTCVECRKKLGRFLVRNATGQKNNFELISGVKMETTNHVEGYFGSKFPSMCNHCGVMVA